MMVDTGAKGTVVDKDILLSLGIPPTGDLHVRSLHTVELLPAYYAVVSLEVIAWLGRKHAAARLLNVVGRPPPPANLPDSVFVPHQGVPPATAACSWRSARASGSTATWIRALLYPPRP